MLGPIWTRWRTEVTNAIISPSLSKFQMTATPYFPLRQKSLKEQLTEHRLTMMSKHLVCKLLEARGAMILLVFRFGSSNCAANGEGHRLQCPGVRTSEARLNLNWFKLPFPPQVHGWVFHERHLWNYCWMSNSTAIHRWLGALHYSSRKCVSAAEAADLCTGTSPEGCCRHPQERKGNGFLGQITCTGHRYMKSS